MQKEMPDFSLKFAKKGRVNKVLGNVFWKNGCYELRKVNKFSNQVAKLATLKKPCEVFSSRW